MTKRSPSLAQRFALVLMCSALMAACANNPPPLDWQMNARDGMERAVQAYLIGDSRLEAFEFTRARAQIASTGRADLIARAELLRCATRVASLVLEPCTAYAPLAADAAPAEQAYARYLDGQAGAADAALLPSAQRPFVGAGAATGASLQSVQDPLARLVAAGVLLRAQRADPQVVAVAVNTSSAQGWRRPLLAWLGVQLRRAEQGGDAEAVERIRRRMALAEGRG